MEEFQIDDVFVDDEQTRIEIVDRWWRCLRRQQVGTFAREGLGIARRSDVNELTWLVVFVSSIPG